MTTPTSRFVRGYLSGLQGFERQIDGWMTDLEDHATHAQRFAETARTAHDLEIGKDLEITASLIAETLTKCAAIAQRLARLGTQAADRAAAARVNERDLMRQRTLPKAPRPPKTPAKLIAQETARPNPRRAG